MPSAEHPLTNTGEIFAFSPNGCVFAHFLPLVNTSSNGTHLVAPAFSEQQMSGTLLGSLFPLQYGVPQIFGILELSSIYQSAPVATYPPSYFGAVLIGRHFFGPDSSFLVGKSSNWVKRKSMRLNDIDERSSSYSITPGIPSPTRFAPVMP